MTLTGFTTGNGLWGAYKVTKLFADIARHSKPAWYPMRYQQTDGYEELSRYALITALTFSCGSIFAPFVLLVLRRSSGLAVIITAVGLLLLLSGAVMLFLIPLYYLTKLADHAREDQVELVTDEIEARLVNMQMDPLCEKTSTVQQSSLSLDQLLQLRILLMSAPMLGRPVVLLLRVSLLMLLPLAVAVVPSLAIQFS